MHLPGLRTVGKEGEDFGGSVSGPVHTRSPLRVHCSRPVAQTLVQEFIFTFVLTTLFEYELVETRFKIYVTIKSRSTFIKEFLYILVIDRWSHYS